MIQTNSVTSKENHYIQTHNKSQRIPLKQSDIDKVRSYSKSRYFSFVIANFSILRYFQSQTQSAHVQYLQTLHQTKMEKWYL